MYKFIDSGNGNSFSRYVIEREDIPEIHRQVIEHISNTGELPSHTFTVSLIEVVSEEQIELEINPFKYIAIGDALLQLYSPRTNQ